MKRLCLFVNFWHEQELPRYIVHHVAALAAEGCEVHFISNSPVGEQSREQLEPLCRKITERKNVGFDFGAWRDAISAIDLNAYDSLLLTNSSIVGPLHDLGPVFATMDARPVDFWGLTLNRLYRPHLQSFFLHFSPQVWKSAAWGTFWDGVVDHPDKRQVILDYELSLYQHFCEAGFQGGSFIKPNPLYTLLRPSMMPGRRKRPVYFDDPTIVRPIALVQEGFPYVKASLLWGEAMNLGADFETFRSRLQTGYDWTLVEELLD